MKKIFTAAICLLFLTAAAGRAYGAPETVMVVSMAGDVKVMPAGQKEPLTCKPGMHIREGAAVMTGRESYVELAFDRSRNNVVRIGENSEVIVKIDGYDKIELIEGTVFTHLKKLKRGETFRVRTPGAVCGARGTAWETTASAESTGIAVLRDKVFVRGVNRDGSVMEDESWVETGFRTDVKKFGPPAPASGIPADVFSELEKKYGLSSTSPLSQKKKGLGSGSEMLLKHKEQIQERKGEDRIERLRDRKDRPGGGGSTGGKKALVGGP